MEEREKIQNSHKTEPEKHGEVKLEENTEYSIVTIGDKKRFIPKQEEILIGNETVDRKELIKAMALFPDDGPAEALKKLRESKR